MPTQTLSDTIKIFIAIFISVIFLGGIITITARAQISNITFPIPELGNCASKSECRAYCDIDGPFAEDMTASQKAERREACQSFAQKNHIGKKQQIDAGKFGVIKQNGGPGGSCGKEADPISACSAYCSITAHVPECVAYAKKHKLFEGKELEEAEKVSNALKSGAKLPEACKDAESCKEICENAQDLGTAKQCFAFAEKAGLLPENFDHGKAEKFFKLIEEGNGPFKDFKDFRQCEKPADDEILKKCIEFGEKNGFISADEARIAKETGGKGPGGCLGQECKTYCDSEEHQDECIKFSEEHNFISPEQKAEMEKGMQQFKDSINKAPEEVKTCLKEALGGNTLDQILFGNKRPSRELGDKMRSCFENFFSSQQRNSSGPMTGNENGESEDVGGPRIINEGQDNSYFGAGQFPPEVASCIKDQIGTDEFAKLEHPNGQPSKDIENAVGDCFSKLNNKNSESNHVNRNNADQGDFKNPNFNKSQAGKPIPSVFGPNNNQEQFNDSSRPPYNNMMPNTKPINETENRLKQPGSETTPLPPGTTFMPPQGNTGFQSFQPTGTIQPLPTEPSNYIPPREPIPSTNQSSINLFHIKSLVANVISLFTDK